MRRLVVLGAAVLVGCAPRVMSANSESITIDRRATALSSALSVAEDHCADHGKVARPAIIDLFSPYVFDCVQGR